MKCTQINSYGMLGENFEICSSEMYKNALKSFIMFGTNVDIYSSKMAKNALISPTIFAERFTHSFESEPRFGNGFYGNKSESYCGYLGL